MQQYDIIIVGAGISGAVLAERYATILGKKVLIIDKRDHIGGNCFDFRNEAGILVAKYGPHYFHTNDEEVWNYVSHFTSWIPYEHKVVSHIDGLTVPVPVNITTVNKLFGTEIKDESEMIKWLKANTEQIIDPKNSEEAALARVGKQLYEKLFRGYTTKQWDAEPKDLGPEVMNRIPVRTNFDDRYFTDKYQGIPENGYTAVFERMLSHQNIDIRLNTTFDDIKNLPFKKLFFTGRIDAYFNESLGKLEYRSLRFEFETFDQEFYQTRAQENYPDPAVPYTRIVEFKHATREKNMRTTICKEYPTWDGEPYYPVPSKKNKDLYEQYKINAMELEKNGVYFVGRLANYKYFNMDQAFKNSLDLFEKIEKVRIPKLEHKKSEYKITAS